jgi:hypothetical protein
LHRKLAGYRAGELRPGCYNGELLIEIAFMFSIFQFLIGSAWLEPGRLLLLWDGVPQIFTFVASLSASGTQAVPGAR